MSLINPSTYATFNAMYESNAVYGVVVTSLLYEPSASYASTAVLILS